MPSPEAQQLPSNVDLERTILGACLVDVPSLNEATDLLRAEDFYLESHQRLFTIISTTHKKGSPVDIEILSDALAKTRQMDAVGGFGYVAGLTEGIPRKINIESYIRIVRDSARRRDLFKFTQSIGEGVLANEDEAAVLLGQAKRWLAEIEDETIVAESMESVGQYLTARYANPEDVFLLDPMEQGIASGYAWQDEKTGGYVPGRLYIIGGRPSMGKTAKAVNDVSNICLKSKKPVALFTFEQPKHELIQRLLCCRATANLTDFIKGRSDAGDKAAIRKAYGDYLEAPLYWDERPGLTASQIRASAMALKKKLALNGEELAAIFIDQLSFMSWEDVYEKGMQVPMLIGRITRSLKRIAKELHVPIILLCQLKRPDKGSKAPPTLADLKESGSIEENADVVAFVHRAEYYDRTDPDLKGKGEYIIAKQRQGPVGSHVMKYMAPSTKWVDDWTPKDDDDGQQIPW